ncbi:MAG: copper amine oxidase N-terminal domain-containing protein [Syntrophomonadaceae bacterium]
MKMPAKIFAVIMLALFFFTGGLTASPDTVITLDGRPLAFDVPPRFENGTALVPVRAIFEALGASVSWDEAAQKVTAVKGTTEVILTVGENTAYRNGASITLSTPAQVVDDRTLVPLRFVSEAFGAQVSWNQDKQEIAIKSPGQATGSAPAVPGQSVPQATPEKPAAPAAPAAPAPPAKGPGFGNGQLWIWILGGLLILIGALSGARFVGRFKSKKIEEPIRTGDPIEDRYQEGLRAVEQERWTDANSALVSLSLDKYKDAEALWNYAVAREQYTESKKIEADDPYWSAYMADYCCRNIPDDYEGVFKEKIMAFKILCKTNLAEMETDPVAQMKHANAQERNKQLPPSEERTRTNEAEAED